MSSQKVLITGATGYIGGSVLGSVVQAFPDLQITALLRSLSEEFTTRYPRVKIVIGDFDSSDVIAKASSEAGIVLQLGPDHRGCAEAILSGLSKRTEPSFFLHLTGTGCISDVAQQEWAGKKNPEVWNDITNIDEIYNLPKEALHREIDRLVTDASGDLVKTLSIVPPDIYGQGTGIGKRTTFLIPEYIKIVMERKEAFYLGEGDNMRAVSHIEDVASSWVLLLGEALAGGGRAQWGKEGFYFAVADEVRWKDAAEAINKLCIEQGWLPADSKTVSYTAEEVGSAMPSWPFLAKYIWGSNSRAKSARLESLGWKAKGPSFWDALPADVAHAVENRGSSMGMTK
ncbi:hypothetical protein LSUE1_G003720 [Lachnellula suecica]|uniref:NAD-dependent epimerase/dehydratase domain-containing protein n=1 Tax=Lachnellula suecica TaxID=602035 RepID=A0A8T9CDE8_9HELO|nr:hypothetical protein LSUE1_G003720 [Lachnellula suecica]